MLESMVQNPRPTRAEVTDVANAIWDGTDAVMLSAETAAGQYPVQAVAMMDRIARAAERDRRYMHLHDDDAVHAPAPAVGTAQFRFAGDDIPNAIGAAARALEEALPDVDAIVAFTRDGDTARLLSKRRPVTPVLALTEDESVYRRLALYWGVLPVRSTPASDLPALLREAERAARDTGISKPGDILLVVGHLPAETPGSTNFMMLHRVE